MRLTLILAATLALVASAAHGQIILGPFVKPPLFIPPNPEELIDISAGMQHTCVRKRNGNTYCWGRNDDGQAGVEGYATCSGLSCVSRPRYVMAARQVESGARHTCAVDSTGRAFCWGSDSHGQLGNAPDPYSTRRAPFPVSGNHVFNNLSSGETSTCGTSPEGLFCWGSIASSSAVPSQISTNASFQSVSVGRAHACALYVVGDYRGAYCWGQNQYGQAGVDWNAWAGPSVPFAFLSSLGTSVSRLETTADFTCADQVSGVVQCTGLNDWGQLGSGQFFSATFVPQTAGVAMALHGVSVGSSHACALDAGGRAWCWGNGYRGQLGNGAPGVYRSPQPVYGGRSYRAIAVGSEHTCAIGTDNHVYCWGDYRYGQVGNGYEAAGNAGEFTSMPAQALDPV
ncbi:MAG: hypothetical protein KF788_13265 [Piscinibacter sp.]|nr:hypothetical protein [Piscinibacter sp.]